MVDNYHQDTSRIGKSGLDLINKSPRHYWNRYLNPDREVEEESDALIFGRLLHCVAFEPENYALQFVIAPDISRRSNAGKEQYRQFVADNAGKTIIYSDQYTQAQKMIRSVKAHPAAKYLFSDETALKEYRMDFEHPTTGTPGKIKMDYYSQETGYIIDLKSTEDASEIGFGKSSWNYRYDVQAAWYLDGFEAFTGEAPAGFIFVAVEKSPPFEVAVYFSDPDVVAIGRKRYLPDLLRYEQCRQSGEWPGYSDKIQPLVLPAWAKK